MDLLKYLEPMKNLPERFSNLAFWRGCRKFKDSVVNAFEYVDSWGESIETEEAQMKQDISDLAVNVGAIAKYNGVDSGGYYKESSSCNWISLTQISGSSLYNALAFTDGESTITIDNYYLEKLKNVVPVIEWGSNKYLMNASGLLTVEMEENTSKTTTFIIKPSAFLYNANFKLIVGTFPGPVPLYVGIVLELNW